MLEKIKQIESTGEPVRIIVLKARQMGISTFCSAYIFWKSYTNPYTTGRIIAHDDKSTNNIFNMVKRYYELMPEELQVMKRFSNKKELVFENPDEKTRSENPGLMSQVNVDTAGSRANTGRSSTIHNLHISEHAFWPDATASTPALLSALSKSPGSTCFIESTANGIVGIGGDYYNRVQKSIDGKSNFELFFIPWTDNPEYQSRYNGERLSPSEEQLLKDYNLTHEQIMWRRRTIEDEFNGDELVFRQEFPLSVEEAFIVSGTPYFDSEDLHRKINIKKERAHRVCSIYKGMLVDDKAGTIHVFENPIETKRYIIGADISDGLPHGDFSTAFVMDTERNQVAGVVCKIDPDLFGDLLVQLAKVYNQALIVPEINNMGAATIAEIKRQNYPFVYHREVLDEVTNQRTKKLGWRTTNQNKLAMLADMKASFRRGELVIEDVRLLREMLTVAFESASKVELNSKDQVVACCLAVQGLEQAPLQSNYKACFPNKREKTELAFKELTRPPKDTFTYYK